MSRNWYRFSVISQSGPGGLKITSLLNIDELDRLKTEGMPYRRTIFTFEEWTRHRSSGRYLSHLRNMFQSGIIASLWPPVLSVAAIATFVTTTNSMVLFHKLPAWVPLLHLNSLPFSLTSSALSFLLVFCTNSSYSRFVEAGKMWERLQNRSRDMTRQALAYVARNEYEFERPKLFQLIRHVQGLSLTYKHHFLEEGSLEEDLRKLTTLTDSEIVAILASGHRPNYILTMCSEIIANVHIDSVARLTMDKNLTTFFDDVGGSERLFKTPIPVSYTRLTSRFLALWHIFLPLGLWDTCGVLTVPVSIFIAAVLFCVDEVGTIIEEPFSILAMGSMAETSISEIQELMNLHESMKSVVVANTVTDNPSQIESHQHPVINVDALNSSNGQVDSKND